ncbi:MAG: aminotransferase class III-fold pyridoxal phosphate-dependent enzyme, partial [Pseudomonadales bacterium]
CGGSRARPSTATTTSAHGHRLRRAILTAPLVRISTLTATGNRKVHAGFEPLLNGFVRAPFNDIEAVRQIAQNNNDIVAVLTEPLLGEGGIVIPDEGYLPALRELCDSKNWLLILDEVQTGIGRTGKFFAYQHTNIFPDVVTTAKGLANGVPIGACLGRGIAAGIFQPGNHGSTFGGNPLACAAAQAVLDTLEEDDLLDRAALLGTRMLEGFTECLKGNNRVTEIRGKGLMIAIELSESCTELVSRGLDAGILINVTQDNIVRLLPPLTLADDEADEIVRLVSQLIND